MARILQLPQQLADQIAAGEVIERPASVVKELLENSIDAGSTQIEIDIGDAGFSRIMVRDNGTGIAKEDLHLALMRHATSKITQLADLSQLQTLGFRGEALASIAAVSHVTLTSKPESQDSAWQLTKTNWQDKDNITLAPAAHPTGTTVDVQQLFYNTPVRKKFLNSLRTEFSHVQDTVARAALSAFQAQFKFSHQGRLLWQLPIVKDLNGKNQRLAQICGSRFMQNALWCDIAATGLRLSGWLGLPEFARSQSDLQYCFLNGRMVRDKLLLHAIRQAYSGVIPPGRQATFVLYLDVAPDSVDVNVHPTKHEVRFIAARLIHDFIVKAITETGFNRKSEPVLVDVCLASTEENDTAQNNFAIVKMAPHLESVVSDENKQTIQLQTKSRPLWVEEPKSLWDSPSLLDQSSVLSSPGLMTLSNLGLTARPSPKPSSPGLAGGPSSINYLFLSPQTLLVKLSQETIWAIDLKQALHLYYQGQLQQDVSRALGASQPLLFPIAVRINIHLNDDIQISLWQACLQLGIDIAKLATDTIAIRRLPRIISEPRAQELVLLILENYQTRVGRKPSTLEMYQTIAHDSLLAILSQPEENWATRDWQPYLEIWISEQASTYRDVGRLWQGDALSM